MTQSVADPAAEARAREAVSDVVESAHRDVARTQTDFLGRMGQALCSYEGIFDDYPDGELPDDVREEAEDHMVGLAGLALAQLVMLRCPSNPLSAFAATEQNIGLVADKPEHRLSSERLLNDAADHGAGSRSSDGSDCPEHPGEVDCCLLYNDPWAQVGWFQGKLEQSEYRLNSLREAGDKLVKKYQAAMLAASPEPPASDRLALVEAQGEEIEKLRADVRSMLRDIHCGGEWSDEHDDIRDRLRAGMGEDAKGDWRWWWKPHDDETFCTDHGARDEAIAAGFAAEPGADMIDIVEARVWSDGVDIEDDIEWFAEQRNAETVAQAALSNKDTGR